MNNTPLQNAVLKILLVDDSEIVGTRITAMLDEIEGIEILGQAKNSKDALVQIKFMKPHIVLLDIQMGDDNGVDLLSKIKSLYPDVMVIMLSNFAYPYYRKICSEQGADYFFDKSNEFENILDLMKKIVA